jgi:hypothetical protein
MEGFEDALAAVLKARPGLTKERLAAAMGVPYEPEFRKQLDEACDRGIAHKVQDKYYPGERLGY